MKKDVKREVDKYIGRGYSVLVDSEYCVTLEKKKKFSLIWCCIWTLFFGIGAFGYLLYYWAKRDLRVTVKK